MNGDPIATLVKLQLPDGTEAAHAAHFATDEQRVLGAFSTYAAELSRTALIQLILPDNCDDGPVGSAALEGIVALWALYFGRSERLALQHVETTSDPIRASRFAVNGLIVIVAGLIAFAVGNETAIAHPEDTSATLSALVFGGPLLFLFTQAWYLRTVLGVSPRVQMIGSVVLVLLGTAFLATPRTRP